MPMPRVKPTGVTEIELIVGAVTVRLVELLMLPRVAEMFVEPAATAVTKPFASTVATATYSDGSSQDLVNGVTWSSSTTSVATVNNSGLVTTVGAGTTTITATVGSFSDSSTLTVVAAHLLSIAVSPATPSIAVGTTQQFSAVGTFDDGSTQLLTSVTWSSSAASVASVSSSGLATAGGTGSTTITPSSGGVTGSASLTVSAATL